MQTKGGEGGDLFLVLQEVSRFGEKEESKAQ